MRDQSIGINLVGRDVSASKTLNKVGGTAKRVGQAFELAGTAAAAFAVKLGKESVQAAIADQKAVANLNRVLMNNGFGAASVAVSKFISDLQMATGVSEDELRPAFIQLFSALGSVTRSQEVLRVAMDTSAATGRDLSSVVAALAKTASGSKTAISRLGLGIDKTRLAAMSFDDVVTLLTDKFGGATATAADTMAGKFQRLKTAVSEAKEEIGVGLLSAFDSLAAQGGSDIDSLTAKILHLGTVTGDVFRGIGVAWTNVSNAFSNTQLGKLLNNLMGGSGKSGVLKFLESLPLVGPTVKALEGLAGLGADQRKNDAIGTGGSYFTYKAQKLAEAAAAKKATDATKKLTDAKAKEAAARKKAAEAAARELRLKQLAAKFDLTLIGLAAAKGRATDKDTVARLDALNILAQDAAGLPVSDKALANASTQVNNITVNAGSILTEQDLLQKLALSMQAQIRRNDSGQIYWARL